MTKSTTDRIKSSIATVIMIVLFGSLAAAFAGCSEGDTKAQADPRLAEMRTKGADASLTIYPISLGGRTMKEAAAALGMFLDRSTMQSLAVASTEFQAPEGANLDALATAFSEYVADQELGTEYAIYAEYLGHPRTGVEEVRAVVVDTGGHVVWTDSQKPGDDDFDRIEPEDPMGCTMLLAERFRTTMGLPDPMRADAEEGPFARAQARETGLPDEEEREAMDARLEELASRHGASSLVIYPVRVGGQPSREDAESLAVRLEELGFASVLVAETSPELEVERSPNEQRILWSFARSARESVQADPPEADYALFADYLTSPDGKHVGAVHLAVLDRSGELVLVDFQNSHHEDFQTVSPASREDCGELAALRLSRQLD
jgi:hypothetical protein